MVKKRLDQLLVERDFFADIKSAQARIMSGDVIVNEHRADKASDKFATDAQIRIRGKSHSYVSRGGLKLEHALSFFGGNIKDACCLDVGASTGGFTEVLLIHGARIVYAVDVGYGQLAEKLRRDARVISLERTHILDLSKSAFSEAPKIAVVDVSFISLKRILAHVVELVAEEARIYALIKPQFEVERAHVDGGIVKDEKVREQVVAEIIDFSKKLGLKILGIEKSPILGAKGNVEFLLGLEKLKR